MNLARPHHATDKLTPFHSATVAQQRIAADEARAKATIEQCFTSPEKQAKQRRVDLALAAATLTLRPEVTRHATLDTLFSELQRIKDLLSGEGYFDYDKQVWIED